MNKKHWVEGAIERLPAEFDHALFVMRGGMNIAALDSALITYDSETVTIERNWIYQGTFLMNDISAVLVAGK
jgi:hypothetical protein